MVAIDLAKIDQCSKVADWYYAKRLSKFKSQVTFLFRSCHPSSRSVFFFCFILFYCIVFLRLLNDAEEA